VTGALAGVCYSLLYSRGLRLVFGALAMFFLLAIIMIAPKLVGIGLPNLRGSG